MKQFLLPRDIAPGESLELGGADYHYLFRVRRIKKGQKLEGRTPSGTFVDCLVQDISNDVIIVTAVAVNESPPSASDADSQTSRLHLVQCLPKGKKLDLIVRQAVEIGVASISLIKSLNSVPDFSERWDRKKEHINGIIREAYQQSGGTVLPIINEPTSFKSFVENYPLNSESAGFFLHEQELEKSSLHGYLDAIPREIRMIVGPEGGLAPEEVNLLVAASYRPLYLGKQILRCETAAAVGLGAIALVLRESPFWSSKG